MPRKPTVPEFQIPKSEIQNGSLLDAFQADLHRRGVVGEERALRLLYLILTSRLLKRPVSAVLKGPSSAGKSFLIERVLEYFPESAYYAMSAMSEHAMIYDDTPLAHRMLILYEANGAGEMTTYLLRSILSEGRVRYVAAERGSGGTQGRTVEREGPTGLITTTAGLSLHPENETRMLSIPVTDTAGQTASILLAMARDEEPEPVDPSWPALQRSLETAERRVLIPYAEELLKRVPPIAVRLRRDCRALLSLIQAHAILHQSCRDRDPDGRILATVEDYAALRLLVEDLFAETAGAAVPAAVRQAVSAVDMLAFVGPKVATVQAIAALLGIDKSNVSRAVRNAIELGYLQNTGGTARIRGVTLGEPVPTERSLLPDPKSLTSAPTTQAA
jgi:hypothetical protein